MLLSIVGSPRDDTIDAVRKEAGKGTRTIDVGKPHDVEDALTRSMALATQQIVRTCQKITKRTGHAPRVVAGPGVLSC